MNTPPVPGHGLPASLPRRRLLVAGAGLAAWPATWAVSASLPPAVSLTDELGKALRRGEPLLVMVSLKGCPFCDVARNHYLAPLRAEGQIDVVQVDMKSSRPVRDFQDQTVTQDQLIRRWTIRLAPTVLFFGRGGVEVAERLVGGSVPDFYGAYLDQRLDTARRAVRGR